MKDFLLHNLWGNIVLLLITGFVGIGIRFVIDTYNSSFITTSYFYACRDVDGDKCYKVRADFGPPDCDEVHCIDAVPNKLIFENGSSLEFSCIWMEKDKWFCKDDIENNWDIQFAEQIKIKK